MDGTAMTTVTSSYTTTTCASIFMDLVEAVGQELGIMPSPSGDNDDHDENTIVTPNNGKIPQVSALPWASSNPDHVRNAEEKEIVREERFASIRKGPCVGIVDGVFEQIMALLSTSAWGESSFEAVDHEPSKEFTLPLIPSSHHHGEEGKVEEKEMEQDDSSNDEEVLCNNGDASSGDSSDVGHHRVSLLGSF